MSTEAGTAHPDTGRSGWERRQIGTGAHGERIYDWTTVALDPAGLPDGWGHWLLVRRQTEPGEDKTTRELAFYRCAAPAATPCVPQLMVDAGTPLGGVGRSAARA